MFNCVLNYTYIQEQIKYLVECDSPSPDPPPFPQMRCCSRHLRRTGPAGSRNELVTPTPRSRRNGWTLPLGTLQVFSWFTYFYFLVVGFGIYIPLLPSPWNVVAYGVSFTVCMWMHGEVWE